MPMTKTDEQYLDGWNDEITTGDSMSMSNLFKTKVIAPKPGGNTFSPMGVVEAGFQLAYLANDAEVDSFRALCIGELERVCENLKQGMRAANDKMTKDQFANGVARLN